MLKNIITLLFFYLIIIYFYSWRNLIYIKDNSKFPQKTLYKDNINSGDIFLLGNKKYHKLIGDSIFRINFIHPAIAVWEDSNLYIVAYGLYPTKRGLLKIHYDEWLNYNKNKKILHSPLSIKKDKINGRSKLEHNILNFYNKMKQKIDSYDSNFNLDWIRFPLRIESKLDLKNISCTEVMTLLLQNTGIVKKNKGISYYHPSDFISLKGFELKDNYIYNNNYLCKINF